MCTHNILYLVLAGSAEARQDGRAASRSQPAKEPGKI